jgi:DNA-binding response OmpR family regulator
MSETTTDAESVVLIADDDEDILALVKLTLGHEHCRVLAARDGIEALQLALDQGPDLAVLDLRMPGLSGQEVLHQLRENDSTREMPVIVLSAYVVEQAIRDAYDDGAADYMAKPFSPIELARRVENLLGHDELLAPAAS